MSLQSRARKGPTFLFSALGKRDCMKKTVLSENQTYFSTNINEMASAKLSPYRFFSSKSEEAIDKLRDEFKKMDKHSIEDSYFLDFHKQSSQSLRLKTKPISLVVLTERQMAEEDEDEDHDPREIKKQKIAPDKKPLDLYYYLDGLFVMSEPILQCFDELGISNYRARRAILKNPVSPTAWKDYWVVQFFGKIPSPLVTRYAPKLFREWETDFVFFTADVKNALQALGLKYVEYEKHTFSSGKPRSKKAFDKDKAKISALLKKESKDKI
ncbi:hypothetical protein LEP1GSC108_1221 [Leptospira weilii str. UI 13098]|uniref:Uncharacterized protein n=2 Tax=Leptospira weilii TaxID=28184 RepID=M6QN15_9LEPT|nr:hypothetical protein LEP1GSC108_1221 [Leptospira weilii str. UI 13098]